MISHFKDRRFSLDIDGARQKGWVCDRMLSKLRREGFAKGEARLLEKVSKSLTKDDGKKTSSGKTDLEPIGPRVIMPKRHRQGQMSDEHTSDDPRSVPISSRESTNDDPRSVPIRS